MIVEENYIFTASVKMEVLSLNQTVYVPAGTFSCVKIKVTETSSTEYDDHTSNNNTEMIFYFSRQFGLIMGEFTDWWTDYEGTEREESSTLILLNKNF